MALLSMFSFFYNEHVTFAKKKVTKIKKTFVVYLEKRIYTNMSTTITSAWQDYN